MIGVEAQVQSYYNKGGMDNRYNSYEPTEYPDKNNNYYNSYESTTDYGMDNNY